MPILALVVLAVLVLPGALMVCLHLQPPPATVFTVIESRDAPGLARLLATTPQAVGQTCFGRTPLHLAVVNDRADLARMLVEAGAAIQAGDEFGNTPLHLAVFCLRPEMVSLLLQWGAPVNQANRFGSTPLHLGAFLGASPEIMGALLDHGADPARRDGRGRTPRDLARGREAGSLDPRQKATPSPDRVRGRL